MNIIDQLEQIVTPAVLGANSSVAHVSLLEQFYAILVTRLAIPEVYTELQRINSDLAEPTIASSTLFEQLWQQPSQRHLLIQELAATHHIDEITTEQLVTNTAHLAYQELKNLANGQFLPAFLQAQEPAIRQYLPAWATAVVAPVVAVMTDKATLASGAPVYNNSLLPETTITAAQALAADDIPVIIEPQENIIPRVADAIHADPSAHHIAETRAEVRSRNQRNDLKVRLIILTGALLAAGLIWALFFRNDDVEPEQPVVIAPVVVSPEAVPPTQVLIPAQLVVGVDDSGNLYTCSATVGDVNLQNSLRQALMASFGDQASICDVTVQEGVATTLATMNIATLPNVLSLMRTAPFSRLQLQNDSISLEAPDEVLLQRLIVDVRTLIPTMTITTAVPIAIVQPPTNTYDETYNNSNMNNGNNNGAMPSNSNNPITTNNNVITNQPPASNNSIETAPPPPPQSSLNNNNNGSSQVPSGPISLSEVDDMANTTIVSEPAQGGRQVVNQ